MEGKKESMKKVENEDKKNDGRSEKICSTE